MAHRVDGGGLRVDAGLVAFVEGELLYDFDDDDNMDDDSFFNS